MNFFTILKQFSRTSDTNPSQEGYYNSNNPLVEGVPHIFTGLEYSGASRVSHTSFPVVQFIGLQYSVLS